MDYIAQVQYKDEKVINVELTKEDQENFYKAVNEKAVFHTETEDSGIWVDLEGYRVVLYGPKPKQEEKKEEPSE